MKINVPAKLELKGNLSTIEEIEDPKTLQEMYKQANDAHAAELKRTTALEARLDAIKDVVDSLIDLSSLGGEIKNIKQTLHFMIQNIDDLTTANKRRTGQIADILQRLNVLEKPEIFENDKTDYS